MRNISNKQNSQHDIKFTSNQDQLKISHLSNKSIRNSISDPLKQTQPNQQITQRKISRIQNKNKSSTQIDDFSFGSNIIIDYQNAKFQGRLMNKMLGKKSQRLIKGGLGILMDDELNFVVSNWKNDNLSGKSVLLNRAKNYFFGKWNQQTSNPSGPIVMRVNTLIMITKFSEKSGKWCMVEAQRNVILIYDETTGNLLVVTGRMQQTSHGYKCSKTTPLTVVEFVHFDGGERVDKELCKSKNKYRHRQGQNTKEILSFYCQKYAIQIDESFLSLPQFLQQVANDAQTNCIKSKNFAINVSKHLLTDLLIKQKQSSKESQTYESQKNKLFDNNCIVYKQHFHKSQTSKETFTYFGFLGGLGIKFINTEKQLKSMKEIKYTETSTMQLKSMGNHNLHYKIQDIGGRFYDNKCIEEGNFKTKSTFTYEDVLFRPSNKLASIYNKYHKQQTHFVNEYFDRSKLTIFKLLANFQAFVDEHVIYVMNQCYLETSKFQQKEQKNQLVSSLLTLKSKIDKMDNQEPSQSVKNKKPTYQFEIQRKSKSKSKSKGKNKFQQEKNEGLSALKNKNNELKERIKKVKYEIQYEPQSTNQNVIIVNDDKLISKIKKHLTSQNYQNLTNKSTSNTKQNKISLSKSKTKSQVSSRPRKDRKNYIQREKQKILSNTKMESNDDSLQKVDGIMIKKVQISNMKEREKTEGEKLLQKINGNIGFRQKFNYGIEYHKHHESFKSRRNDMSPVKNKYNGRERLFTDDELDKALEHTHFSASEIPVRSITPGTKSRKKEQYRHFIYSNTQRNINNEQENYQNQKEIQDTIRAEMLGMPLAQYREMILSQKRHQTFMDGKLLQIIDLQESILKISRRNESIAKIDANETFGFQQDPAMQSSQTKRDKAISTAAKQRLALKKTQQKYLINGQRINNPIIYCPKPRQESLIQRRLRILQEYKKLNTNEKSQAVSSNGGQIITRTSTSPINKSTLFGNKEWLKMATGPQTKEGANVNKLPIYQQRMNQKIISPLRTIKHDFSTIEAYSQRSGYLQLTNEKGQIKNEVVDSLNINPPKSKEFQVLSASNNLQPRTYKSGRKYQYYFDK